MASSPWRAIACTETGKPLPVVPNGIIMAGWPVRLNQTVNGLKLNTRRQYSSRSSIIMSSQPSLGGSVPRPGVSRMSQSAWNAAIWRPTRCAVWTAAM